MAEYIEREALENAFEDENKNGNFVFTANWIMEILDNLPPADVVPKSEVDKWYHEYHAIKDELKQEKMYHRETEKLADKYFNELQTAKSEVAREIFEDFTKHKVCTNEEDFRVLAQLKKKYTEEHK